MTPPLTFDEDRIRFEFDASAWSVLKWDASAEYTEGIRKLNGELTDQARACKAPEGTKGVDLLGLHERTLYFFEIKDFRDHAEANAYRQEKELSLEIGLKVRDTIAGLIGAHHMRGTGWTEQAVTLLADRTRPVVVVAWIVEDRAKHTRDRRRHTFTSNVRTKALQQSLSWLTPRVWDDDPLNPSIPLPGIRTSTLHPL